MIRPLSTSLSFAVLAWPLFERPVSDLGGILTACCQKCVLPPPLSDEKASWHAGGVQPEVLRAKMEERRAVSSKLTTELSITEILA